MTEIVPQSLKKANVNKTNKMEDGKGRQTAYIILFDPVSGLEC